MLYFYVSYPICTKQKNKKKRQTKSLSLKRQKTPAAPTTNSIPNSSSIDPKKISSFFGSSASTAFGSSIRETAKPASPIHSSGNGSGLYDISRITRTANAYREYTPRIPFNKMCLPVTLILFSLLSILLFPFFFCFFAISICRNLRGTKNRFPTAFLTAFLTVRKNPVSFLPLAALLLRLRCPDALRRPPPPDGASGLHHPYCTPPTSTFFPLLTFFSFLLYIPFFNSFSFFCISLSVHLSFLFLFMRIFMCTYRLAFGTQLHQLPLALFPCICLFVHSFFFFFCAVYAWLYISLCLDTLACTFFFLCIPLRIYLISQSAYACRTLYIFLCISLCVYFVVRSVYTRLRIYI